MTGRSFDIDYYYSELVVDIYSAATEVKVFNLLNEEYETFTLVNEHEHNSIMTTFEVNNMEYINLLLCTKDQFGVSNQAYHEFSMVCKETPRTWKVNK